MARIVLLICCLLSTEISFSSECIKLFKDNKVFSSDKECLSKCLTLQADMATFSCNLRCEKYCSSKCKIDPYWESKIKDGRPKLWDLSSEKTKEWSTSEREALEKILTRLPDDFKKYL